MEITHDVCPRCQQRFIRSKWSGDFVHTCHGEEVLRNEDVLIIGDWVDYTGSDVNVSQAHLQSLPNPLQGTRAQLEGAKEQGARTTRGFPTSRYRTRQHLEYLPEEFFKKKGLAISEVESFDKDGY